MTGLDTALQQNPAALYQQTMVQHPEQFSAVLVETRQIAGQRGQCFDLKSTTPVAAATDGRFCYSSQGITLLQNSGETRRVGHGGDEPRDGPGLRLRSPFEAHDPR